MSGRTRLAIGAIALAAVASGGLWLAHRPVPLPEEVRAPAGAPSAWYTCSMHPEVVQDHPGNCPQCGMKLRPMPADRAAAMGLASGERPAPEGERKVLYWRSSMIPGEIHQEPGKDSMGMDLVPVYADEVAAGATIRVDPVIEQNMGIRVDTVTVGPLGRSVRAVGYVDYDETTLGAVTTKVGGWVEKLHVDRTGAQVHAGDPLFDLYSPELYSAQEEYLAAVRAAEAGHGAAHDAPTTHARLDAHALVRAARTRLAYFDVPADEIRRLERAGTAKKALTIRAPFTGVVIRKDVVQGQRIEAGMEVFRLADLSTVWVVVKVFESDLPFVRLGQEAFMTLAYLPGRTFHGRVTYVYPYLDEKTREISARVEFHNPGYELKPGMYATVNLTGEIAAAATLVPDEAVIDTGTRAVAFVVTAPGRFEPRDVRLGPHGADGRVQVLSGLRPGETVVVSGQFLLDSESRLREAALKFLPRARAEAPTPVSEEAAPPGPPPTAPASAGNLYYVCPMPEHVDILYDAPGRCPLCGMDLVPVTREAGHVEPPRIAYWTCPMPEHRTVHEKGPGKCPLCGMTLVPVPETP